MAIVTSAIYYLFTAYFYLIVISILLSWIPGVFRFGFFKGLKKVSDAYLGFFSGYLTLGMFDFTPIIGLTIYRGILYAYASLVPVYDLFAWFFGR